MARLESHSHGPSGARTIRRKLRDRGRRVVHLEAIRLALGCQSVAGGISWRIRGHNFQVVGAVRHGRRIPAIEASIKLVLQQFPCRF